MMDTGIADRLRAAGLRVVEVDGWKTRSAGSFDPRGSVNHHTAGSPNGSCPSLSLCINGRTDLPGPLCNVLQSREPDGNDIAYVIAAGRANHAGSGGWQGLSGNSSVWGLEIEHTGTVPLPAHRQQIAARIHAAMSNASAGMTCQHYEWAPTRKIDAATEVDPDHFRSLVVEARLPAPPPIPPPIPLERSMDFVMWHPGNNTFWYASTTGHFAVAVSADAHAKLAASDKVESFAFTAADTESIIATLSAPADVDLV